MNEPQGKEQPTTQIDNVHVQNFFDTERTVLSNERTLLSFIRTALALIATGATFIHFVQSSSWIQFMGWTFLMLGFFTILAGIYLYLRVRKEIQRDEKLARDYVMFDGGDD